MAIYSLGPVVNLNPDLTFHSRSVELRISNTTAARLEPIVVNVYSNVAAGPEGSPAVLYFTTTFAIAAADGVVTFNIPTTVQSFIITVSSPAAATFINDISIYAAGRDAAGLLVPDHAFPFGDWNFVTTP
ncbi:hypothetical protein PaeBR_07505 [Paenibacillus sp. BR2-3]|uniref:hypothetical protein n=1 Tax=Paenibacillus sp. BR2-3 TaxID=3048494 RepID=UPI0039778382